jgi:hypothetical protein
MRISGTVACGLPSTVLRELAALDADVSEVTAQVAEGAAAPDLVLTVMA